MKILERVLLPLITLFLCKTTWVVDCTCATSVDGIEGVVSLSVTSKYLNVSAGSSRHSRQLEIWES